MKTWLVIIGLLALAACSEHGDVLPPIDVIDPPTPDSLKVETTDYLTFHLSWKIDDPSLVTQYRIYVRLDPETLELWGTAAATDTSVLSPFAPVPVAGLVWCVSAITIENVESQLTCGTSE